MDALDTPRVDLLYLHGRRGHPPPHYTQTKPGTAIQPPLAGTLGSPAVPDTSCLG